MWTSSAFDDANQPCVTPVDENCRVCPMHPVACCPFRFDGRVTGLPRAFDVAEDADVRQGLVAELPHAAVPNESRNAAEARDAREGRAPETAETARRLIVGWVGD